MHKDGTSGVQHQLLIKASTVVYCIQIRLLKEDKQRPVKVSQEQKVKALFPAEEVHLTVINFPVNIITVLNIPTLTANENHRETLESFFFSFFFARLH